MPRARSERAEPKVYSRPKRTASTTEKKTTTNGKKRTLSPEPAPAKKARVETAVKPASKPAKADSKPAVKAGAKPASKVHKAEAKSAAKPASKPAVREEAPDLNALPVLPAPDRPAPLVFIWGASDSGQLGLGENYMDEVPRPKRHPWVEEQVAAGTFGAEAGAGVVTIASGGLHTYLLDEKGRVWSTGTNDEGSLGRITKKNPDPNETLPKAQEFALIQSLDDEEFRVVQLATGDNFGAALNNKGELKVWGTFRDDEGASSFSSGVVKQLLPTSISVLGQTTAKTAKYDKIAAIAGGENHLVALTTRGEVYSWGIGGSGQLGRRVLSRHKKDALLPQRVVLGIRSRKAVLIGSGLRASFAVDEAGDVWGWGLNSVGQLGIGERGDVVSQPTKLEEMSPENLPTGSDGTPDRVVQIRGGEFHTLLRTQHGRVYVCGACNDYQLGLPDDHEVFEGKGTKEAECVTVPVLVPMPDAVEDDDQVVHISSGPRYNMAVTKHGVLLSWGVGLQGELGLAGNKDTSITPQVVVRREGSWAATQVSCGGQHVVGLFKKREGES